MTTEYRIIKKGYAKVIEEERNIVPEGDKNSANVGKKMIWVMKYLVLIEYEESRISHLIIYDSDVGSGQPKKIIVIDKHISVQLTEAIDEEQFCLMIYKDLKDSVILAYDTVDEIIDWKSTLKHLIKKALSAEPLILPRRVKPEKEPEMKNNMIYEDSNISNNMYAVEIQDNETANRLNLHGNYTLKLYDDGLQLLDKETENVLYSWSVNVLRRYGASNNRFSFESGRRSETGVGTFTFLTPFNNQIDIAVSSIAQCVKFLSSTDLQNRTGSFESRNTEISHWVPKHDIKPQIISSNTNKTSSQFSGEGLNETLEPNEDMGYTRNLDNSKNLKIENDIYGGDHIYTVKIIQNETAKRFELRGDYDLQLRDDTILLLNMGTNNVLFSWPVEFLRRYDCSNNTFSFETGRRSETGVGRFVVSTIHCEIITQKVFEMCEHVKESKAKSDSYKSESTDPHERTDREEPRDDTTAKGPKIIWKNYPLHYFDTREHTPEPDQQTPRGIQCQQDSPEPSLELRELEISNYPEWTPQCPVQRDVANDILIFPKSKNLYENIFSKKY